MTERSRPAPRAVILDMDGTLVDSEPLAHAVWTAMLTEHGLTPSPDDLAWGVGRTFREVRDRYARRVGELGRPELPSSEELYAAYWQRLRSLFATELRPFDDAVALVTVLRERHVPVAVASNSPRERVMASLAGVGHGLDRLPSVAGDEVERPKPAPDLVVAAAERLGVQAYECVVVEDSDAGGRAAHTAGAAVVRADQLRAEGEPLVDRVLALLG